ncbi:MAG: STAS domain-containing protein [Solirubrobacteraceae bacterium]
MPSSQPHRPSPASGPLAAVSRHEHDGVIVATVRGEIDVSNASEIGRQLTEISNHALGLVVDLDQVVYLDSSGIALLYELNVRLGRRKQQLVVVARPRTAAARVLEMTAFAARAVVADDVEAGIAAVRSITAGP